MKEPFYNAELTLNPQQTVARFVDNTGDYERQRVFLAPVSESELTQQWANAKGAVSMRRGLAIMNMVVLSGLAVGWMFWAAAFSPDIDESVTTNRMTIAMIQVFAPLGWAIIAGLIYAVIAWLFSKLLPRKCKTMPRFDADHEIPENIQEVLFLRLTVKDHRAVIAIEDPKVLSEALRILAERYTQEALRETDERAIAQEEETERLRSRAQRHLNLS